MRDERALQRPYTTGPTTAGVHTTNVMVVFVFTSMKRESRCLVSPEAPNIKKRMKKKKLTTKLLYGLRHVKKHEKTQNQWLYEAF